MEPYHVGFRAGRQANKAITVPQELANKCMECSMLLLLVENGIRKAFDRIFHSSIITALDFPERHEL
jgi:hypothetical protein